MTLGPPLPSLFGEKKIYRCQRSIQQRSNVVQLEKLEKVRLELSSIARLFKIVIVEMDCKWNRVKGLTNKFKKKFLFIFLSRKIITRCNYSDKLSNECYYAFPYRFISSPTSNYGF